MKTKKLSREQIDVLIKNHCKCDDWNRIEVSTDFDPTSVTHTEFQGIIILEKLDGSIIADGIARKSRITNARLQNCIIGAGVSISNVNGWLSNLKIGTKVLIENVGTISSIQDSTFGNGHVIDVWNEGGGREFKISDKTSAQIAYMTVAYRHNQNLISKLDSFVDNYVDSLCRDYAAIGDNAQILNCESIHNVVIGTSAIVRGAISLRTGTINSSPEAPTIIENGVIMEDFIVQKGASVSDGAMVSGSLIGEATKIGKQFSVENSVFFANSEGFHSEACSVFAGPYSVTHHRSTLLIAAMISFYNAGSGTNQSNHMYKLGPLHQGIMERGCKTGSFSYLLWPSRVGAFSVVMGKHTANFDSSDFPFSYVNEEDGQLTLVPGMNFFTVGTLRDGEKWPKRDKRKNKDILDLIIFDVLSPYTAQKMIQGENTLLRLSKETDRSQKYVIINGARIKRLLLKTCSRYYKLALQKYFGDLVIRRMEEKKPAKLRELFIPDEDGLSNGGKWIDMSGLLCQWERVDRLIKFIEDGDITGIEELQTALKTIYDAYRADEWNWFLESYEKMNDKNISDLTDERLATFFEDWKTASLKLLNMVTTDAGKEFDSIAKIGFGIDGNAEDDFAEVRGTMDENAFILSLKNTAQSIEEKYQQITNFNK
ncbi:MAG: DUF4954 family protein [Candidatus Marinimicrobia bacterium]|nr:DUF4954 family protein [Candidatus Neomarinimicrobiota bacterium]